MSINQKRRPGLSDSTASGPNPARWPLVSWKDVYFAVYLVLMTPVAWCLPERIWPGVGSGIEWILWRARRNAPPAHRRALDLTARLIAGTDIGMSAEEILRGHSTCRQLARLQLLRCHRPGGWHPRIQLVGEDRLRRALETGRGAIIWAPPTALGDLVTKMAFHRAGFRVSHLSRYTHGFSSTRFGHRVLNPVRTIAESRFLAERLEMGPAGPFVQGEEGPERAVDAIARRLERGQIVSIAFIDAQARIPRYARVLNGWLPVGDGAIRLARRTGAALFPVVTIMREDGGFTTTIEAALDVPAAGNDDRDGEDVAEAVLAAYGSVLEGHVLRAPEQFSLWYRAVESPATPV